MITTGHDSHENTETNVFIYNIYMFLYRSKSAVNIPSNLFTSKSTRAFAK